MAGPTSIKDTFNARSAKKYLRIGLLGATLLGAGIGYHMLKDDRPDIESIPMAPVLAGEQQAAKLTEWKENWREMCLIPGAPSAPDSIVQGPDSAQIRQIKNVLERIESEPVVGAGLVKNLRDMGTAICVNPARGVKHTYYDDMKNTIFVKHGLNDGLLLIEMAHESRRAMQKAQGMRGRLLIQDGMEKMNVDFALEADVVATTALLGWRMKEQGKPQLWKLLTTSPYFDDVNTAFLGTLLKTKDEKQATLAAFEQWYTGANRMRLADQEIQYVRIMTGLDRRHLPAAEKSPKGFFERLGELPDGSNYGANKSPSIKPR